MLGIYKFLKTGKFKMIVFHVLSYRNKILKDLNNFNYLYNICINVLTSFWNIYSLQYMDLILINKQGYIMEYDNDLDDVIELPTESLEDYLKRTENDEEDITWTNK